MLARLAPLPADDRSPNGGPTGPWFDSAATQLLVLDGAGVVLHANASAARHVGHDPRGSALWESGIAAHAPTGAALLQGAVARVLARGERAVVELEGRDATAAPLAIEFTISPMDGAGTLLVEGHDVTARRSREQRRRDVLGDAAHELRAPLVGVRGALAMLEASHDARVDARARDLLRLARANADRLMRCVTDLLDLDRIRSGVVPVASQSTAAVAIARSAVEALGPLARARGVRLTTRDIRSGAVLADHDRAAQVLATLLSCAVDAAAEGSTLRVTASRVGAGRVRVALDDPEGAISAEGRRAIAGQVERVECADAVPATAPGGESGLGVAIARALIERQGGSLGASADADRAGVCWVELPAAVDVELATVLLD